MEQEFEVNLFQCARRCIDAAGVDDKLRLTRRCARDWREGRIVITATAAPEPIAEPGRPARPPLVHPSTGETPQACDPAGQGGLSPRPGAYRIQRHQSGVGCGLSFSRDAG